MTWCASNPTLYLYTDTIRKLLGGKVSKVQSVDDFWQFMETDFIDGVYLEEWYNEGTSDNFLCPNHKTANGKKVLDHGCKNIIHFHFQFNAEYYTTHHAN